MYKWWYGVSYSWSSLCCSILPIIVSPPHCPHPRLNKLLGLWTSRSTGARPIHLLIIAVMHTLSSSSHDAVNGVGLLRWCCGWWLHQVVEQWVRVWTYLCSVVSFFITLGSEADSGDKIRWLCSMQLCNLGFRLSCDMFVEKNHKSLRTRKCKTSISKACHIYKITLSSTPDLHSHIHQLWNTFTQAVARTSWTSLYTSLHSIPYTFDTSVLDLPLRFHCSCV